MLTCLQNIVTLGICPDAVESTSGFKLLAAPGISIKNMENIANENYVKGTALAMEKKGLALAQVRNDFIAALQLNKVTTMAGYQEISTGVFNPASVTAASSLDRGVTLHKASQRGTLRQTIIKEVQVYPLQSGAGTLNITNGTQITSWDITLVAGSINVFTSEELQGLPYALSQNANARVTINAPGITFAGSVLTCLKGCNDTLPNPCGWVDGWNGAAAIKEDGFGVNIVFYCKCNYDQILCDLATSFIGELIWLKWQIAIFEEQLLTNRFNNLVIYKAEQLRAETLPNLESKYAEKWTAMMNGLFSILQQYRDECLNCRGVKWVVSI